MNERPEQATLLGEEFGVSSDYAPMTDRGYPLDEVVSSMTKEIRRGNEDLALYWAMEMVTSGYANYFWKRLCVVVPEEIGLADPQALLITDAAMRMYERRLKNPRKWTEGPITSELVGMVILYLCRAPKNNEAAFAAYATHEEINHGRKEPVQDYGQDMHTKAGKAKIRNAGMTKDEEGIWWYTDLMKRENIKPGNRWIRRMLNVDDMLESDSRAQVQEYLFGEFDESLDNQL